jgi:ankyrin repeat protein
LPCTQRLCCEPPEPDTKDPEVTKAMIEHLVKKYAFDVNGDYKKGGSRWMHPGNQAALQGSALNWACYYGNTAAVEVLLGHGAKATFHALRNVIKAGGRGGGRTRNTLPAVKLLLEKGVDPTGGRGCAIWDNYIGAAKLCLEHGANTAPKGGWQQYWSPVDSLWKDKERMSREMEELLREWRR